MPPGRVYRRPELWLSLQIGMAANLGLLKWRRLPRGPRDLPAPTRRLASIVLLVGLGGACAGQAFLLDGDAYYARVAYAGDIESATAVAKRHCAPFERVPRFREIEENAAYFDCVRP